MIDHSNAAPTSPLPEDAPPGTFRHAVTHAQGPIGSAVVMTIVTVLVGTVELWGVSSRHRAMPPTTLLFPIIALGMWRSVRLPGFDTPLSRFRIARMAMLAVIALVGVVGAYRWNWRGIAFAIPVLAVLQLIVEVWNPFESFRLRDTDD